MAVVKKRPAAIVFAEEAINEANEPANTVTVHLSVLLPFCVVTVITVVPSFRAVTRPLLETVAMALLLLDHVTFLFVVSLGWIVAVSCS
jgi:hypothetical protein